MFNTLLGNISIFHSFLGSEGTEVFHDAPPEVLELLTSRRGTARGDASFTGLDMIPEERRPLLMLAESNASGLAASATSQRGAEAPA